MNSRPRRLFQQIGQRIGVNWFRQPRAHMILVRVPEEKRARSKVNRDLREHFASATESVFSRRQ